MGAPSGIGILCEEHGVAFHAFGEPAVDPRRPCPICMWCTGTMKKPAWNCLPGGLFEPFAVCKVP